MTSFLRQKMQPPLLNLAGALVLFGPGPEKAESSRAPLGGRGHHETSVQARSSWTLTLERPPLRRRASSRAARRAKARSCSSPCLFELSSGPGNILAGARHFSLSVSAALSCPPLPHQFISRVSLLSLG